MFKELNKVLLLGSWTFLLFSSEQYLVMDTSVDLWWEGQRFLFILLGPGFAGVDRLRRLRYSATRRIFLKREKSCLSWVSWRPLKCRLSLSGFSCSRQSSLDLNNFEQWRTLLRERRPELRLIRDVTIERWSKCRNNGFIVTIKKVLPIIPIMLAWRNEHDAHSHHTEGNVGEVQLLFSIWGF